MHNLVSVIIPIYNTSEYLNKCINSVIEQTYNNLQIILVDDGSTDFSPQICEEWAMRDARIEVIHKQNEGLGYARNTGLELARGDFLVFLDSDDTIDSNTIEECVKELEIKEAEACYYGRKTQLMDGSIKINNNIPSKLIYSGTEVKKEFAGKYFGALPNWNVSGYIQESVCCGMYRASLIRHNSIWFRSERECLSEDTFFNIEVCKYASKVIIIPRNFYNYTYNAQSLTKKYNPSKFMQFKNFYRLLENYSTDYQEICDLRARMGYTFYVYLRHIIEYEVRAKNLIGLKNVYTNIKSICEDKFVRENLSRVPVETLGGKRQFFIKVIRAQQVWFLIAYYLLKDCQ